MRTRHARRVKPRRPQESQQNPEESQKQHPDWLIFSLPLLSRSRCVSSSKAAAPPRGDAAQAAFERKTSHYRMETPDFHSQSIVYRPVVWTADGRVTAIEGNFPTSVHKASCVALWSGRLTAGHTLRSHEPYGMQQISHQWAKHVSNSPPAQTEHKDPTALLRRRAAMTRAILPNTSTRETLALGQTHRQSY